MAESFERHPSFLHLWHAHPVSAEKMLAWTESYFADHPEDARQFPNFQKLLSEYLQPTTHDEPLGEKYAAYRNVPEHKQWGAVGKDVASKFCSGIQPIEVTDLAAWKERYDQLAATIIDNGMPFPPFFIAESDILHAEHRYVPGEGYDSIVMSRRFFEHPEEVEGIMAHELKHRQQQIDPDMRYKNARDRFPYEREADTAGYSTVGRAVYTQCMERLEADEIQHRAFAARFASALTDWLLTQPAPEEAHSVPSLSGRAYSLLDDGIFDTALVSVLPPRADPIRDALKAHYTGDPNAPDHWMSIAAFKFKSSTPGQSPGRCSR